MSFKKDIKISYVHDNSKERAMTRKWNRIIQCIIYVVVVFCFLQASAICMRDLFLNFDEAAVKVNIIGIIVLLLPMLLIMKFLDDTHEERKKLYATIGLCVCYIVAIVIYLTSKKDELLIGLGRVRWYIGSALNSYYKLNFSFDEGSREYCGFALSVCFFVITLITLFFALIIETRMLLIIIPVFFYVISMCVGYAPKFESILFLMSGILITGSNSWERYQTAFGHDKSRRKIDSLIFTLIMALIIPIGSMIMLKSKTEAMVEEGAPKFKAMQKKLDDMISRSYEKKLQEIAEKYEGQESETITNRKPIYDQEKMFEVTLNEPPKRNVYFKEFYGVEYKNGSWESMLDKTVEFEKKNWLPEGELTEWIKDSMAEKNNAFFMNNDYWSIFDISLVSGSIDYDIKTKHVQIPDIYSVTNEDIYFVGEYLGARNKTSDSVRFTGYNVDVGFISDNEVYSDTGTTDMYLKYNEYVKSAYTKGCDRVPTAEKIAENLEMELMSEDRVKTGSPYETNCYRIMAAERVARYLSTAEYNLELSGGMGMQDKVEFFLANSHEGFCIHFASAGTLILQNMGIPARYASGYVATKSDFIQDGNKYNIEILDSDAHAWTEIYLDNIGWIPIEMTTGYGGASSSGEGDISITNDPVANAISSQDDDSLKNTTDTTETTSVNTSDSDKTTEMDKTDRSDKSEDNNTSDKSTEGSSSQGHQTTSNKDEEGSISSSVMDTQEETKDKPVSIANNQNRLMVILIAAIVFATLIVVFGAFICRKYRHSKKKVKKYIGRDNRKALALINENIVWKIRKKHIMKTNYSDEEFLHLAMDKLNEISSEDWIRYMQIVQKASFSNHEISVKDIEFCISVCYTNSTKKDTKE